MDTRPLSEVPTEELKLKAHRLRSIHAQEIGARAAEHAAALEEIVRLRSAFSELERRFDDEADVDDGIPNAAMVALGMIRETLLTR